jgi:hypothetical protein
MECDFRAVQGHFRVDRPQGRVEGWGSPKNVVAAPRPFELPQQDKSAINYRDRFASLICYMMRAAPHDDWEDETGKRAFHLR